MTAEEFNVGPQLFISKIAIEAAAADQDSTIEPHIRHLMSAARFILADELWRMSLLLTDEPSAAALRARAEGLDPQVSTRTWWKDAA